LIAFARKFWPVALVLAALALMGAIFWIYRTRKRRR
jgi:LPXTG-motif cell wall-anchored protein